MPTLKNPLLITFDVYSALLNVHKGVTESLQNAFDLPLEKAAQMARVWRVKQLERAALSNSLNIGRTLFSECTRQSLNYVCKLENISVDNRTKDSLVADWDCLPLWPEADAVLKKLEKNGYDLAILSNGDSRMLEAVSKLFSVKFKFIFSSESVGFYKPHRSVYELPSQMTNICSKNILHIAGGPSDVQGAVIAGLPCVWSNKNKEILLDDRYPADFEICNLSELEAVLDSFN